MDVDTLHAWVREDFGLELSFVEPLTLGSDAAAALWRATTSEGERLAVKWTGGGSTAGLELPALLASRGVPGVLGALPSLGGARWTEREGRRLVVQPWLDGPRPARSTVLPAHWAALGALLGQVHEVDVASLPVDVPRETHDPTALVTQVRDADARWRSAATDLDALDRVASAAVRAWCAVSDDVLAVASAAVALAPRLQADESPLVLCHADPHLGNVLLHGERWVWLLDWDDAVLAHPEADLMFVLDGGVLAGQPVRDGDRAAFESGYLAHRGELVAPQPHRLAYYQCTRGLWDAVDWTARAVEGASPADRLEALAIARSVLSPCGLVAAALRTVRSLDG
ncbi:hypothetical protein GCM10027446_27760 [Angustibacter peucedani]